MKKKFVMLVVLTMMACSFCGAVAHETDLPQLVDGLRNVVEAGITITVTSGETPADGVPGGPPGIPG